MTTLALLPIDARRLVDALTYNPAEPMLFSTGLFLWLFAAFCLVYALLRRADSLRLLFVVAFSYYFYYKSSGLYLGLLALVTLSDYLLADRMGRTETPWKRRALMAASITIDLGLLAYFKYTNFLIGCWNALTGGSLDMADIFLPVGISFFTFQSMSYTIDVYRRQIQPLSRLLDYAFYVSFFPQLVAGPIVRARDFLPQIRRPLRVSADMLGRAVYLIAAGLLKKAVISDYISLNYVDRVFDNPGLYSGVECLLGVYGYALQIYCDFSGYSDMAIGLALLMGFHFNDNFRSPYRSSSVTEFWRRWHISLSSWLRDYLYISLGGNRRGRLRQRVNLMVTMLLGGLWHGASWNFVVWGGLHGLALVVHKAWRSLLGHGRDYCSRGWRRVGGALLTFHFVCLCWVFFRQRDMGQAFDMLRRIVTDLHPELLTRVIGGYPAVFALMAVGYLAHLMPDRVETALVGRVQRAPFVYQIALIVVAIWCVILTKSAGIQPFIYFQF